MGIVSLSNYCLVVVVFLLLSISILMAVSAWLYATRQTERYKKEQENYSLFLSSVMNDLKYLAILGVKGDYQDEYVLFRSYLAQKKDWTSKSNQDSLISHVKVLTAELVKAETLLSPRDKYLISPYLKRAIKRCNYFVEHKVDMPELESKNYPK